MIKKNIIFIVLISLVACNNKAPKDARVVELTSQVETIQVESTGNFMAGNFSLILPQSWEQIAPSNSMRFAEFKSADTPDYPIVVSFFGNMENNIQSNIERWKSQFSVIEEMEELTLDNKELIAVKIVGTYKLKSFPMAQEFKETPDYGMLVAIVPSDDGPYFFKLTAPKLVIESQAPNFITILNSYKKQ